MRATSLRPISVSYTHLDVYKRQPEHILRRVSPTEVRSLNALYRFLEPGELLGGRISDHAVFHDYWAHARSDSFAPPERLRTLLGSKAY